MPLKTEMLTSPYPLLLTPLDGGPLVLVITANMTSVRTIDGGSRVYFISGAAINNSLDVLETVAEIYDTITQRTV